MLVVALLGPSPVRAQDEVTPPMPLESVAPEAPQTPFGTALEGWVTLRYTVLADGSTEDVRVIDSMPPQLDPSEAVRAVESWTFTPAMAGGEAVPWFNNESVIVFDDPEVPLEPTPMFAQAYREVVELINQQEFEDAQKRNERLMTSRLGEIGVAQTQLAYIDATLDEPHAAYTAILRATDPAVPALKPAELNEALRYRFVIEIGLGRAVDALETYRRRQDLGLETDDPLAEQAAFIEEALKGDNPLGIKGLVGREPWLHRPSRRTFTFANVDGDIREIRVECDRRTAVLEYMPDVDWTLPESWGSCVLFVDAKRDTTFTLYEFK